MDQENARIGALGIDHESPKEEVSPGFEEKISRKPSTESFRTAGESGEKTEVQENQDVEAAQTKDAYPAPVKVPRSQRRGLFGRFTILAEVEEPKHYTRRTKWFITFVIALAAAAAPLGSAIIFRESRSLISDLRSTITEALLIFCSISAPDL